MTLYFESGNHGRPSANVTTSSNSSIISSSNSTLTLSGLPSVQSGEEITVEGLVHSPRTLEARRYRSTQFVETLLVILRNDLAVKSWTDPAIEASHLKIFKVSGSLTNAVFFVSAPEAPSPPHQVLLRIYGHSSSFVVSRPVDLYILHALSSIYGIGPRVYGTFGNGRVEQFFDSQALTREEMKNPEISRWIGRRMSELHSVDLAEVMPSGSWEGVDSAARRNFKAWFEKACEVIRSVGSENLQVIQAIKSINIEKLKREWEEYSEWLDRWELTHGKSDAVFAHNDAQYGNLLKLNNTRPGKPSHHQIIVVDFEYAAPNPPAFDIANHFNEWTTDYNGPTPHLLDRSRYPTAKERQNFYHAYLSPLPSGPDSPNLLRSSSSSSLSSDNYISAASNRVVENQLDSLEKDVRAWSPASHAMWAVWGIVQAEGDIRNPGEVAEFDYLRYAQERANGFRMGIAELGIGLD